MSGRKHVRRMAFALMAAESGVDPNDATCDDAIDKIYGLADDIGAAYEDAQGRAQESATAVARKLALDAELEAQRAAANQQQILSDMESIQDLGARNSKGTPDFVQAVSVPELEELYSTVPDTLVPEPAEPEPDEYLSPGDGARAACLTPELHLLLARVEAGCKEIGAVSYLLPQSEQPHPRGLAFNVLKDGLSLRRAFGAEQSISEINRSILRDFGATEPEPTPESDAELVADIVVLPHLAEVLGEIKV